MKRQVHVWMRDDEYEALKRLAADRDESVGNLVRRQVRMLIRHRGDPAEPEPRVRPLVPAGRRP